MIHIEGMGVIGCQVAAELGSRGIDFTWSDTDSKYSAWNCCTGIAYPSGHDTDLTALEAWRQLIHDGRAPWAAEVPYLFAHKYPPHGGRYLVTDLGRLRLAAPTAVAVDVPAMVTSIRDTYAHLQRPNGGDHVLIRCHTTPEFGAGYLWGWAARVSFDQPYPMREQPAYYAKAHRFNITYAYPLPGSGQWWAGSSLLYQHNPASRDAQPYLQEWLVNSARLLGVSNVQVHSLCQGWRPRSNRPDQPLWAATPGGWTVNPSATGGLRHGPLYVAALMRELGQ